MCSVLRPDAWESDQQRNKSYFRWSSGVSSRQPEAGSVFMDAGLDSNVVSTQVHARADNEEKREREEQGAGKLGGGVS